MTVMTVDYFERIRDYVHPNVKKFVNYYKDGNLIQLPLSHGCCNRNKNGTKKLINYTNGY